jgi:excisionase family DNA binding protein
MKDGLNSADDRLLDVGEVAAYLNLPAQTLYSWRVSARGPRGIKIGRHLRFRRSDVESWLDEQSDYRPPAA